MTLAYMAVLVSLLTDCKTHRYIYYPRPESGMITTMTHSTLRMISYMSTCKV